MPPKCFILKSQLQPTSCSGLQKILSELDIYFQPSAPPSHEMDKTEKSFGRVVNRCQEQLMEASEQGQRAQASITLLKDVICTIKNELGLQDSTTEIQVQALTYDLRKLDLGPIDKTPRCRLVGHEICIECHTVIVAGCNEISGVGGNIGSAGPSYASQKAPDQSASGPPKRNHNSRRGGRRGRGGSNQPPQRQNKPQPGPPSAELSFGCPFYFHDKEEHQSCLNYKLKRIGDVRQHIWRSHVQPSYCPRCGIVFQNDINYAQRDIHINDRQRICEAISDLPRYSGATSDQLASMTTAANHRYNSTDRDRWYSIWDLMFPGVDRPPSPYVDVCHEWSCIEVHAAVARYRQNGGPEEFIRQWAPGLDVLGILNEFLNHFRDYDRITSSTTNPGDDTPSDTHYRSEPQSTIPVPLPTPPPVVPQPPHIEPAHTRWNLPDINPNLHGIYGDGGLDWINNGHLNDNHFDDSHFRGGDSDTI
ncbi:hypothetical protein F4680DRAFT_235639 [Xylaria scruposa]|nr:hypothetical protein F4680DRAFT_235639 [Xylaria scruposa]